MREATPAKFGLFFFFNDTATTEIYTLSLHDALPISTRALRSPVRARCSTRCAGRSAPSAGGDDETDSAAAPAPRSRAPRRRARARCRTALAPAPPPARGRARDAPPCPPPQPGPAPRHPPAD